MKHGRVRDWSNRYANSDHVRRLLGSVDGDGDVILLARGEGRKDALARLLPESCYDPSQPDPDSEDARRFPAFVLGEKSAGSYGQRETLVRMPSSTLAAVLPEVRSDRPFMTDLVTHVLEAGRIKGATRGGNDILPEITPDAVLAWPNPLPELFIERLMMIVHFDEAGLSRNTADGLKRYSCGVSLAVGDRALTFALDRNEDTRAVVIDSFVRRSEPETFVAGSALERLDLKLHGVCWEFRFDPGKHSMNDVIVRRAIFPHRLIGIAILLRERTWRVLRYVPNPYFATVKSLKDEISIPQDTVIPRMLDEYSQFRSQLRLIHSEAPGESPRYDEQATNEYLT